MLSDKVRIGLENHRAVVQSITDFNNTLLILLFPVKPFLIQKEQKEFYDLVKFARNNKHFERNGQFVKKAHSYLSRYSWINTFFFLPIEPLNLKQLVSRIKDALRQNFREQYELQEKASAKNKKIAQELIRHLQRDRDLTRTIEWSKQFGWLLNWSVEQALISSAHMQPFFKLIAQRVGVPYADWIHLTSEEIIRGLAGKRKLTKADLTKRKKGFVFSILSK